MRILYKGDFSATEKYVPGSVVRMPDGQYKVYTRDDMWQPTAAQPDPILDRAPRDGRDGLNGHHGADGRDGHKGKDGRDGERGARGERGKKGKVETFHTTRIVGRRGDDAPASFDFGFPANIGQAITVNGLASMADPNVIGVVSAAGKYSTEGPVSIGGLTPGAVYYLDATTPGLLSTVAPTQEGDFVVVVGRAIDAIRLDLTLTPPIRL